MTFQQFYFRSRIDPFVAGSNTLGTPIRTAPAYVVKGIHMSTFGESFATFGLLVVFCRAILLQISGGLRLLSASMA